MPEFLQLQPPQEAWNILFANLPTYQPGIETIDTVDASGRFIAETVNAIEPLPAFPRSTVDGYVLKSSDSYGASESLPAYFSVIGEVPMGASPSFKIERGQAALIHTGGMLPDGADAVVMLEYTQAAREGEVEVLRAAAPRENTLKIGEDVQPGEELILSGTRLGPAQIGGLLSQGITRVKVAKKPVISILSSGDEVISPERKPEPGQVRDINSYSLAALVGEYGAIGRVHGIVADKPEELEKKLFTAMQESDMVVITAGSSASARDFTARVIGKMGTPGVLVHGVSTKPGKPTILAVCDGKPIIGLPGNPVSALSISRLFVIPLIYYLSGAKMPPTATIKAHLTLNVPSQAGREDYVPVRLIPSQDGFLAEPIFFKSNLIFTLAKSDGLICIQTDANGLLAGEEVDVIPF